jgi:hypothetical protein
MTEQTDYERWASRYPENKWGEPQGITSEGKQRWLCRICIAEHGQKDSEEFDRKSACYEHIEKVHGPLPLDAHSLSDGEQAESRDVFEQAEGDDAA